MVKLDVRFEDDKSRLSHYLAVFRARLDHTFRGDFGSACEWLAALAALCTDRDDRPDITLSYLEELPDNSGAVCSLPLSVVRKAAQAWARDELYVPTDVDAIDYYHGLPPGP